MSDESYPVVGFRYCLPTPRWLAQTCCLFGAFNVAIWTWAHFGWVVQVDWAMLFGAK